MFFVCADFTTAEGNHTYDVDFFVQGKSKDDLAVLEKKSSIHKEDGKERSSYRSASALNTSSCMLLFKTCPTKDAPGRSPPWLWSPPAFAPRRLSSR
jgi:hypothetical protein